MYQVRITGVSSRTKAEILKALKGKNLSFEVVNLTTYYQGVKIVDNEKYIRVSGFGIADYIASNFTATRLDIYGIEASEIID